MEPIKYQEVFEKKTNPLLRREIFREVYLHIIYLVYMQLKR